MMSCPNCGVLNPPGSMNCGNCGHPVPPPMAGPGYAPVGPRPGGGPQPGAGYGPPPPYPGYGGPGWPAPPGPGAPSPWAQKRLLGAAIVALIGSLLGFLTLAFPWYAILSSAGQGDYFDWMQICYSSSCNAYTYGLSSAPTAVATAFSEFNTVFLLAGTLGLLGAILAVVAGALGFGAYGAPHMGRKLATAGMAFAVGALACFLVATAVVPLGYYEASSQIPTTQGECSVSVPFSTCTQNNTGSSGTFTLTSLPYVSWFLSLIGIFFMVESVTTLRAARKVL